MGNKLQCHGILIPPASVLHEISDGDKHQGVRRILLGHIAKNETKKGAISREGDAVSCAIVICNRWHLSLT